MADHELQSYAELLRPDDPNFPPKIRDTLHRAQKSWLKNPEVADVLLNYAAYSIPVARDPPYQPPGPLQC